MTKKKSRIVGVKVEAFVEPERAVVLSEAVEEGLEFGPEELAALQVQRECGA